MRAAQILGADRLILDLQDRRLRIADLIRTHCHELLTQWTCAGEHPTFDGTTYMYMFYVIQEEVAGIWGASRLSDPKQVTWQADGTVKIIEHIPDNVARRTLFTQHAGCAGWVAQPAPWQTQDNGVWAAPAGDSGATLVNPLWGKDVAVEVEIQAEAGALGSLLVRCNPSGTSGYRIGPDCERQVLSLYLRLFAQPERLIQERSVWVASGQWHKLKLVAQGQFLDVYVDNTLVLVRVGPHL